MLLEFYIFFPLLLRCVRGNLAAIIAATAALHACHLLFDLPTTAALDQFCEYALYFALGLAFVRRYSAANPFLSGHVLLFTTLFAMSFLTVPFLPDDLSKTVVGLCSLPGVYALVTVFRAEADRRVLLGLGEYTFAIYLMNTLWIGLTKGVLLLVVPWDHANFLFFFPVLLAAGVMGPILVHRYFLSRVPALARITK